MEIEYYIQKLEAQKGIIDITDFEVWIGNTIAYLEEIFPFPSSRLTNFQKLQSDYNIEKIYTHPSDGRFQGKALEFLIQNIQYLKDILKEQKQKTTRPHIVAPKTKDNISIQTQNVIKSKNKIFISHSSKDEFIIKKFVDIILDNALCFDTGLIFCSSIESLGIKSGEDFRQRIKAELLQAGMVLQFISKNYKQSEICLNEMGAAWAVCDNVVPFIIGNEYDVGFIHKFSQQLKINLKKDIQQFVDDESNFFPNKCAYSKIDRHLTDFLNATLP